MARIEKDNPNVDYQNQIARQYAAPIDKYGLFYSLEDAEAYANDPNSAAYVGQVISVVNEDTGVVDIYKIVDDSTLVQLADMEDVDNAINAAIVKALNTPV